MTTAILSDPRTGSSVLRDTLAKHPELKVAAWELCNRAHDFNHDILEVLSEYDLVHIQRVHIPLDSGDWRLVVRHPNLRVINLTRLDKLSQYGSSLVANAGRHHSWQSESGPLPPGSLTFDDHDFRKYVADLEFLNQSLLDLFGRNAVPILHVTYEDIERDLSAVLSRCQEFIGVRVSDLKPAFERLPPTDYATIFQGWPE